MLQKHLRLVGLVAVLALVGLVSSTVGWAAQALQPATLDPGVTSDAGARAALIAEALPLISKAGYDLKEFDVEKAVADPEGKALFLPVRIMPKPEELPALVGLLYVPEAFQLQGQTLQKGVYPVHARQIVSLQSSLQSSSGKLARLRAITSSRRICVGIKRRFSWGPFFIDLGGPIQLCVGGNPSPRVCSASAFASSCFPIPIFPPF